HGTPPWPHMTWLDGLCLHELATGRQQWLSAKADGQGAAAACWPDGRSIATLSTPPDPANRDDEHRCWLAAVGVTDVATGDQRRLWATHGGHSQETPIS